MSKPDERTTQAGDSRAPVPEQKVPEARTPKRLPPGGQRGGPPWMGAAMPAEKSMNFGPSARRLLRRLRPHRLQLAAVITLAVASIGLSVIGPKLLGHATDLIFSGVIGRQLPAGTTTEQAAAAARAAGNDNYADMLARWTWCRAPGSTSPPSAGCSSWPWRSTWRPVC